MRIALLAALACALVIGCGRKGTPLPPPSESVPAAIPESSIDGLPETGPGEIEPRDAPPPSPSEGG